MKFYDYLMDRYGMTKEVFDSKPEWAKEELRKEHHAFNSKKDRKVKAIDYNSEEAAGLYEMLRDDCGVPFDEDGYPIGI